MAERAAKQLELNKSELPNSITEVIATLSRAGFDAYIVGGGVRDTLLGLRPKDFDAVTDAKPHEIKDVFGKRCRIIGRRFQLAHVYSGRELIEVATFRGPPVNDANTNQDGMIIRDNVWGDIQQDFARRDFSINALYYQPLKGVVHDFCGALDDIDNKIIRLLGNAPVRIEEDPVRLLRALRFKAKLGFEFDDELSDQFHDGNWALLEQISPHRLYDETQKMFTGGYLVPLLPLLFESGAIDSLIIYPPAEPSPLVQQVAVNTDKRIGAGKSINPAFFYAALLWENYLHQLEKAKKRNMPFSDAQMQAAGKVIERQRIKTAIPKFAEQFIRDIWLLQPKLAAPRSKQIEQLSEHPRFRAGFDFLLLREQCGDAEHPLSESTNEMGEWWQTYQTLSEAQKQQAIEDFDENIRRGAYKQEKTRRRDRGRNRQQPIDNDDNLHLDKNDSQMYISSEKERLMNSNQVVDNNISPDTQASSPKEHNKPSRNSIRNGRRTANKLTPREKHDNNELAQLQQLSLANNLSKAEQSSLSEPAPLFVIEHENVVPPLKKQLEQGQPSHKQNSKAVAPKTQSKNETKAKSGNTQSDDKSTVIEQNSKPVAHQAKAKPTITTKSTVAQTPKQVTANNEPIPHQRRRRQLSLDAPVAKAESENTGASYEKKAPKAAQPAQESVGDEVSGATKAKRKPAAKKPARASKAKALQASSDEQVSANKAVNDKGAVPAKRRRRQPSTDTVVTEQ